MKILKKNFISFIYILLPKLKKKTTHFVLGSANSSFNPITDAEFRDTALR